jgi:UDP-3-O-[3-hydroxymyristoyl] glucosamine N-acyltransferase
MQKRLKEIAEFINGEVVGDENTLISGISGIKEANKGDLSFIANSRYLSLIETTRASAVIAGRDVEKAPLPLIRTENPSLAFANVVAMWHPERVRHPRGIHPQAVVADTAELGKNVGVGPFVTIEEKAKVGDNTVVYSGTYVGHNTIIGNDCLIYPNVSIREEIIIGDRVIIHSGAVIGSDGFGYLDIKNVHHKIPQVGTVVIGDDVEIGANVTIDRARFDKTIVGRGSKIDNLVQIAHNVVIGENSIIVAQAGISGSTVVGKNVTLAGQAGLVGHITVGDNSVVAAQAGVTKSVPANTCVSGYPAKPHNLAKKVNAFVQKLPELFKRVKELEKKISSRT